MFQAYVEQGGHLIATAETSRFDEYGDPLDEFQLSDLFGVRYISTNDCDNCFFRNLPDPYGVGIDDRYYVLSSGIVQKVEPTTAEPFGDLHEAFFKRRLPDRFFSHNIHPPYTRIGSAGFKNAVGRGTCIYIPFRLGASYADTYELPEHRVFWGNLVRSLGDGTRVQVDAPLNTEALVRETADRLYVHLITYNPLRQAKTLPRLDRPLMPSQRMEEPMLYRGSLRVKCQHDSVTSLRSTQLEATGDGAYEFTTDQIHEILVIEK